MKSDGGLMQKVGSWRTVIVVAVTAFLFRLLPLVLTGSLGRFRGYDDGVHYAAGVYLLTGKLPYRDFTLVHPPGIAVLMAPFAFIGSISSDQVGIAFARVLFVLIGTMSATLVAVLLRPKGVLATLVGGGLYAVWMAANIAERSIMLSAVLNVLLLAALVLVRGLSRQSRLSRIYLAGALLGLSLSFKLWAILPVIVFVLFVGARSGVRGLRLYLAGVVSSALLICLPFFLMAPQNMFEDIVLGQIGRSDASKSLEQRLQYFVGSPVPPVVLWSLVILLLVAVAWPWLSSVRRSIPLKAYGDECLWSLLVVVQSAAILTSGSFFDHYPNFVAPVIALMLGSLAGAAGAHRGLRPGRMGYPISIVVGTAVLVPAAIAGFSLNPAPLRGVSYARITSAVSEDQCVWTPFAYLSIVADSLSRSVAAGCGPRVDYSGDKMLASAGIRNSGDLLADQTEQKKLERAEAVVIGFPHSRFLVDAAMEKVLRTNFRLVEKTGMIEVWKRR